MLHVVKHVAVSEAAWKLASRRHDAHHANASESRHIRANKSYNGIDIVKSVSGRA